MPYQKRKFYVVWEGRSPGIYDSWEECKLQVDGFPQARYKAFDSQDEATEAFRGSPEEHIGIIKSIASHRAPVVNYAAIPEIRLNAIAVDGACSGNPGKMEYRGVRVADGKELFHFGPADGGTNNIAEYLALIHVLALLDRAGDTTTPVYSDSVTAQSWIRNCGHRSKIEPNKSNQRIIELLQRADIWIKTHSPRNPILKWDTERWGEIPADFGRK